MYVQIALASKFVSPYHHKCAQNIYKTFLYIVYDRQTV